MGLSGTIASSMKQALLEKIHAKTAKIGIVGLGYVGLPLAMRFAEAGYPVIGLDIDQSKIDALNKGVSYIKHLGSDAIRAMMNTGLMSPTTDFEQVREADALILCVPTPLGKHREPDLSYVIKTTEALVPYIRAGQIISLESTTYPGTTDEELVPRLESTGLKVGKDIFVAFSPEREDPGNPNFSTRTIPKVVGGMCPECLEVAVAMYGAVIDRVVPVSSTRAAEMTKLLENIYRSVNIGLVNEMKVVADAMDIDIWEVIDAAATKPFGYTAFYPGPGLGGHCIPIDPFYLTWKAHEYGLHTRFIELAGEVNSHMPHWVISKIADAMNAREKCIKGKKFLVLGIAYKKNIDDSRESPSAELIDLLLEHGGRVDYSDPHVPTFPKKRDYEFDMKSVDLSPQVIAGYDCIVLSTDHDAFDYAMIQENAQLVIDTRGKYRTKFPNVVPA